jgi:membrane protease YdiL (CAAX protease family)
MPISLLLKDSKPQHLEKITNSNIIQYFFNSIQAGAEELWRFALITMFVIILKIIFKKAWENNYVRWGILFIGLLGSSFVFGWVHTFAYTKQWFSLDITILLGSSGFIYGLVLILTRRLSVVILAHILWDIINTLARSEFDFLIPVILFITAISIILCIVIFLGIKYKEKNIIASLY